MDKSLIKLCFILAVIAAFGADEHSAHSDSASATKLSSAPAPVPCGILGDFGGLVQILESGRNKMVDPTYKAVIPCGGWISVSSGWAEFLHRDGFKVQLGPNTFLEVLESGDQIVLYKGEIYVRVRSGEGELRVSTPNARAIFQRTKGVLLFSQNKEETQLITLENKAWLENRFTKSRKIEAKAGEATSLSLRAKRIVPSTPLPVAIASLKEKLDDFHLSEAEYNSALSVTAERQNRKFASILSDGHEHYDRTPAGHKAKAPATYVRHIPHKGDYRVHKRWIKSVSAGVKGGDRLLFPDKFDNGAPKVRAVVEDVDKSGIDDAEKRRLLNELAKIPPE